MIEKYHTPWLSIWMNPKQTVRWILESNKKTVLLILLFGLAINLENSSLQSPGDTLSLSTILLLGIIFSPLSGYIFVWITAFLFTIAGKWLGGVGEWKQVRKVVEWSSIFYIASLIITLLEIILLGNEFFQSTQPTLENSMFLSVLFLILYTLQLAIFVWWVVFLVIALSEIHAFSYLKGFFTLFISLLLVVLFNVFIFLFLMIFK
ncbi:YIP1 family protein [Paenactinomyces guangxiensis]|uniref:YIP1 family protein n=1 Tax=Paenactinomyces guangxiensis TaxID=1490290 RepID=A0A7W1WUZ4_9BACL|nr:YIP1 family protein [Paenactinomyces guangxiensis]MBA4496331.1 YIP1 family protein [Paenactinomyces guangxiensis]MBH8590860.1 YIP1 family protein [Paenactinomyces guangxiensis]